MQDSKVQAGVSPELPWDDRFQVGVSLMDHAHQEFIAIVNELLSCEDNRIPDIMSRFSSHLRLHFGEEERLMADTGFQSASCHLEEHAAVLQSVFEVEELVAAGNLMIVRELARELARWFPKHLESMDMGLARWASNVRLGGAPVLVCKRPKHQVATPG